MQIYRTNMRIELDRAKIIIFFALTWSFLFQELLPELPGLLPLHKHPRWGLRAVPVLQEELHDNLPQRLGGEVGWAEGSRYVPRWPHQVNEWCVHAVQELVRVVIKDFSGGLSDPMSGKPVRRLIKMFVANFSSWVSDYERLNVINLRIWRQIVSMLQGCAVTAIQ